MKPPIPEAELDDLRDLASLPLKSLPPAEYQVIWFAVRDLKEGLASEGDGGSLPRDLYSSKAWERLRGILDSFAEAGDSVAFDQFAESWKKWGPVTPGSILTLGGISVPMPGATEARPRRLQTLAVLDAIETLQSKHKRAPFRQEICLLVNKRAELRWKREGCAGEMPNLTDRALSKQLDQLGLTGRIGTARD